MPRVSFHVEIARPVDRDAFFRARAGFLNFLTNRWVLVTFKNEIFDHLLDNW